MPAGNAGVCPFPGALQVASYPCPTCKWGHAMGICAQRCLQHGTCLAVIPVPVFPPAGAAAAAGIDVWLGEGAHVGTSVAGASRLVWHGVLQGLCHAATMCSARWDLRSLRNVWLLLQMLACCQPSRAGVVTVTWPRQTWRGVELLTAKPGWVLLGSTQLSPALE